ncbi:MAG TPA: hypothetical protein VIU63_04245 [Nitrospira sp.]
MKRQTGPHALFYPFHLCHEETLGKLLRRFQTVHFRDFMALQLTPLYGMTAFQDRMGDSLPELLQNGRLVQGYDVSGALSPEVSAAVDRDLQDEIWRALFHAGLRTAPRFQLGLFSSREEALLVTDERLQSALYSVDRLRARAACSNGPLQKDDFGYGLALINTSASLVYTYRLALIHGLQAATDSAVHYSLFERSCRRERLCVGNHLLLRQGY